MDALSEALCTVRMTGAIFHRAECTAPWGLALPNLNRVAHVLSPGSERLVGYHLLTEGEAVVRVESGEPTKLVAGDIVIIPHGNAHTLSNGRPVSWIDSAASMDRYLSGTLRSLRIGGGGAVTRFICGYFGCERHADRTFLAGLPTIITMNIRGEPAGEWLESSVRHLVAEADAGRPGGAVLLAKASEALFIEALRRFMEQLPPEQRGWLAAARDPVVGAALALLHASPFRTWTLKELAASAGASRSALHQRFAEFLGESPMTYLARWRLQLAARLLETRPDTVLEIALNVGYASEAAFSRAFKREFGLPPARYRREKETHPPALDQAASA
jgi:AraC-like DNA-binding protein